jgi:hypothetical protein
LKAVTLRLLLASSGTLFLGSIGAFFFFAPLLSIATVVGLLAGLMLSVHAWRPRRIPEYDAVHNVVA